MLSWVLRTSRGTRGVQYCGRSSPDKPIWGSWRAVALGTLLISDMRSMLWSTTAAFTTFVATRALQHIRVWKILNLFARMPKKKTIISKFYCLCILTGNCSCYVQVVSAEELCTQIPCASHLNINRRAGKNSRFFSLGREISNLFYHFPGTVSFCSWENFIVSVHEIATLLVHYI